MPRKSKKRGSPQAPPEEAEPMAGTETLDAEPELEPGLARPARVVPETGQDAHQRYEAAPDEDVFSMGLADYTRLVDFFSGMSDRERYSVGLWRCNPRHWSNKKEWEYIAPPMSLPDGTLEEAVADAHGPGVYRWQIMRDGRFVGADAFPPSLRGAKVAGFIRIAGTPRGEEPEPQVIMQAPDTSLEVLREVMAQQRADARASRGELAEILRATTDGFKVQMGAMVEAQKAQNSFLQSQLEHQRQESKDRANEKDGMWKMLLEIQRELRGGEAPRSTTERLIESLPAVIDKLHTAGMFAPRRPAVTEPAAQPSPAAPVEPPADRPMEGMTEKERNDPMFQYVCTLVNRIHDCWQNRMDIDLAVLAAERVGNDEQFDWLMSQNESTVVGAVDALHKHFQGKAAPPEFLEYVRKVWAELNKPEADKPDTGEPARVDPAVPAPAPATAPDPEPAHVDPAVPAPAPATAPDPEPDSGQTGAQVQP